MRPCTGALIGGIIYSRTKEESCPAKPAARSFPYSTRRQLPARENHTDAKEPPFFCVDFFFFIGLAFGALKAMGALSPSGLPKSKSVGLFRCAGAFSSVLPLVRQRQWVFSPPPARSNQKAWVFFTVRVPFHRSCLRCAKGNGCSLPLRLAKFQKRWSFSLCGFFFPDFCNKKPPFPAGKGGFQPEK